MTRETISYNLRDCAVCVGIIAIEKKTVDLNLRWAMLHYELQNSLEIYI